MPASDAAEIVDAVRESMRIVAPTVQDLAVAIEACNDHVLPFYDALMWATAKRAGCTTLITEDFQTNRELGGVTFVNPFLPGFDIASLNS